MSVSSDLKFFLEVLVTLASRPNLAIGFATKAAVTLYLTSTKLLLRASRSKINCYPPTGQISLGTLRYGCCFTARLQFREVWRFRTVSTSGDSISTSTVSFGLWF